MKSRMNKHSSTLQTVCGQPSWKIESSTVEAYVTRLGGHLAPVTFDGRGRKIRPFDVAPWHSEKLDASIPVCVRLLRGDFLCMPFAGSAKPFRGKSYPLHGETASSAWRFKTLTREGTATTLHVFMPLKISGGRVDKLITLVDGHPALYCRHIVSGVEGPMNPGHHATLQFPDEPGSGRISTSRFVFGMTHPGGFEDPAKGGYCALKYNSVFKTLEKVPLATGGWTDLSRYPARRGFEEIAIIVSDRSLPFAWTAVTFPRHGYVWFALKDPRVLPETIFWISNQGRYYPPWNGRHVGVMGLEEAASFCAGIDVSAGRNPLSRRGFPTCLRMSPRRPTVINYIMACVPIPRDFDRVRQIRPARGGVALVADSGKRLTVPLRIEFLRGE